MVRALAWTTRGVGLSSTWCYTFLCFELFGDNIIINTGKQLRIVSLMVGAI